MISPKKIKIAMENVKSKCGICKNKLKAECYNCLRWNDFISQMASAEIPVDYWLRNIKGFYGSIELKNKILEIIDNIDDVYKEGKAFYIWGERGRGKTMVACEILKKALLKNYSTLYITLNDFVSRSITNEPSIKLIAKSSDFLVIDEVDNRFFPTESSMELYGSHLENVLRGRMQNKLPTIMCSNAADIQFIFSGEFKKSFKSLWFQFVETISAIGPDARKKQEKV